MATKYWIGRSGYAGDTSRWSDIAGVSFTANRTTTVVTYSNLTGNSLANGMTIYGTTLISGTGPTSGSSTVMGVITSLNTSTQTFILQISGVTQSGVITNQIWFGGTSATVSPSSSDDVVFNAQSGDVNTNVYFKTTFGGSLGAVYGYKTGNFIGFPGFISSFVNFTDSVSIGKDTKGNPTQFILIGLSGVPQLSSTSLIYCEAGTNTNSNIFIMANATSSVGGGVMVYTPTTGTTNFGSDIISNGISIYHESGTLGYNLNPLTINLGDSGITWGPVSTTPTYPLIFNGGTNTITSSYFGTSPGTYSLTLNGTFNLVLIPTSTSTAGLFDNQRNSSFYSISLTSNGTYSFTYNTTTSATNFTLNNSNLISDVPGTTFTLNKVGGGIVSITGSSFKDTAATPANTFFASSSKNIGNNTGIFFSSGSFMAFF